MDIEFTLNHFICAKTHFVSENAQINNSENVSLEKKKKRNHNVFLLRLILVFFLSCAHLINDNAIFFHVTSGVCDNAYTSRD